MIRFATLIVVGVILAPTAALAINWMYMANEPGPFMLMSDADRKLFQETARKALDESPDGTTTSWQSPDNDAHGSVEPLSTFERDGMRCRKLRFENFTNNLSAKNEHTLCRTASGEWAFAD
jgi:surface antigen